MKSSGIGGQAVIEGVMMKNQDVYAIAVRKPDKTIEVKNEEYESIQKRHPLMKLPIIRGMVSFIESMVIGMKTLTYSASFYEEEEVKPTKIEETFGKIFKEKAESVVMGATVVFSIILAVAIFMILPFFLAEIFNKMVDNATLLALIEGLIRITIFIAYVIGISFMQDIKRVFMYHGAEHKTINCVEHGLPLTVKNVKKQSKSHKRCGTSFLFIVMFVSIIFFMVIRMDNIWLRMVCRILLVPIIAGISYEFIRLAGNSESKVVDILSKPGLWLQALTTREPDDSMIEVAIASVDAVFDWKEYQEKVKTEPIDSKVEASINTVAMKNSKMQEKTVESELAVAKENIKAIKNKVKSIEPYQVAAGVLDDEDDEILNALDKYFVFEEKKKEP
ncbi:MAG: DUF1385 domain-containing protein [Velocimicrobium sp.]